MLGCFKFLEGFYLLFATKKRLVGNVCGMLLSLCSKRYPGEIVLVCCLSLKKQVGGKGW